MCVHYHTKLCKEIMTFVPFNRFILKFTIGRWACHPVPMTDGCASSDGGDRMWTYYRNGLIPLNKKKVSGVFFIFANWDFCGQVSTDHKGKHGELLYSTLI